MIPSGWLLHSLVERLLEHCVFPCWPSSQRCVHGIKGYAEMLLRGTGALPGAQGAATGGGVARGGARGCAAAPGAPPVQRLARLAVPGLVRWPQALHRGCGFGSGVGYCRAMALLKAVRTPQVIGAGALRCPCCVDDGAISTSYSCRGLPVVSLPAESRCYMSQHVPKRLLSARTGTTRASARGAGCGWWRYWTRLMRPQCVCSLRVHEGVLTARTGTTRASARALRRSWMRWMASWWLDYPERVSRVRAQGQRGQARAL